ncbi:hypothetical protein ACFL1Z_05565 [Thermodesulfobacteriota bacterium]
MEKRTGARSPVNIEEENIIENAENENVTSKENKNININIRSSFNSDASDMKIITPPIEWRWKG